MARGRSRSAHADAEAVELVVADRLDDRAQAVVPARRPRPPDADPSERQVDVVRHDEQVGRTIDIGLADGGAQWRAGPVHVPHRLHEQHEILGASRLKRCRAVAHPTLAGEAPAVGQQVDHAESDVVAREPVALARVAETADDLHGAADGSPPHRRASRRRRNSTADYPPAVERRWTDPRYAPAHADVVVIGGGIIGSAAAAIMADRGAAVVLVEESAIGAGASGRNLGAIQHPFDPVLGGLYAESLSRYQALASVARYGFSIGDEPAGLLLLSRDLDAGRAQADRIEGAFPELEPELIEPDELQRLEPSLAPGPAAVRLATGFPVPPAAATAAWAALAEDRGAVVVVGSTAWPIVRDGRATGVVLADGWTIAADAVLVAAGPWTPLLIDPSGSWRPIHVTWGVTLQLDLDGQAPRHIVEEDEVDTLSRADAAAGRAERADDPDGDPPSLFSLATARGITTLGSTFLPTEPDAVRVGSLLLGARPPSCRRSSGPRSSNDGCARGRSRWMDGRSSARWRRSRASSSAPGMARGASAPAPPPRRSRLVPSSTARRPPELEARRPI